MKEPWIARPRPTREELIEEITSLIGEHSGYEPHEISPSSRLVLDLGIDSLDLVELLMAVEEHFDVGLPDTSPDPVYMAVFTKADFTVADFAELVFLQWKVNSPAPNRSVWTRSISPAPSDFEPFTQWDGKLENHPAKLYEHVGRNGPGYPTARRQTDGMGCVTIPAARAEFRDGYSDVASFRIDIEPVSTTAYARFLNSIPHVGEALAAMWFALPDWDKRGRHLPLELLPNGRWQPRAGTETWPMMLVSWHGANAYALWANGEDWTAFRKESPFLPSTRQFEYAARGQGCHSFPWGEVAGGSANLARLEFGRRYELEELPLEPVNRKQGISPFGLRHMAGNVWHWCRDWLDESRSVRAEKGGSWVGPAELGRCDFTRGRIPEARGRCLGFRCVGPVGSGSSDTNSLS